MLLLLLLQAATPVPAAPATPVPAARTPAPATTPAPAQPAWEAREKTNANGSTSVSTAVTARDGSSRLTVKCDKGTESVVSVQFISRQQLQEPAADGAYAAKSVGLRFDTGPAITYDWQFQGRIAYIADAPAVTALTMFLVKAKTIQVETTTASNFAFLATFDGPKTDASVRQVLSACGYTLGQVPPPLPAPKK